MAPVDRGGSCDISAPKGAFDVGKALGVRAGCGRFDRRISLKIHVEAGADVYRIAFISTFLGVVTIERIKTKVRVGI